MRDLVSGKNGVNYLSEEPLICTKGREVYEAGDLGYAPLPDDCIFPFYELRSAAINIRLRRKLPLNLEALMQDRIDAQFTTLVSRGLRHVILSAFG